MADLDAFEAEVREKIKQLASKDAGARRKAAAWLGEAGDPSAITGLAHTFKHDNDRSVRAAAAYSLGMFRALQKGLAEDSERTMTLLQGVAEGKMGGRTPIAPSAMLKVVGGLIVLAVLIFAAGVVLPGIMNATPATNGDTPTDIPQATEIANVADKDRATLLLEIRQTYIGVSSDAQTLQAQFQSLMQGSALDCAGFYNNPQPYQLSANNAAAFADIATLVTDLNLALNNLATAKARFDQHCDGVSPLTAAEAGAPMGSIVSTIQALPALDQAIVAAETFVPPTDAPTITPESDATDAPTAAPTATVDVRPYRSDMLNILDRMTLPDGANSLLSRYWSEGSAGDGCRGVSPTIPPDYILPPDVSQSSLDLTRAMLQVNTGLALVRDGWQLFSNACASGTVSGQAAFGLQQTATANEAFATARAALNNVR